MNYNHLPIEERIQKAAEYVQLMEEDERPEQEILADLQQMFGLDRSQAAQAMGRMDLESGRGHKAYRKDMMTVAACFASAILLAVAYFFIGHKTGTAIFYLAGLLFLFGLILLLLMRQQKSPGEAFPGEGTLPEGLVRSVPGYTLLPKQAGKRHWTTVLFLVSLMGVAISATLCIKKRFYMDRRSVARVDNLVVDRPVAREGEGDSRYFVFYFKGYPQEFQLHPKYNKYDIDDITPGQYLPGFMLGIELLADDLARMRLKEDGRVIEIQDLVAEGRRLFDYQQRDSREMGYYNAFLAVSVLALLVSILLMKRHNRAENPQ